MKVPAAAGRRAHRVLTQFDTRLQYRPTTTEDEGGSVPDSPSLSPRREVWAAEWLLSSVAPLLYLTPDGCSPGTQQSGGMCIDVRKYGRPSEQGVEDMGLQRVRRAAWPNHYE